MINLTYIVSDIDKTLAFEWIATRLDKEKFNLSFILLNRGNSHLESFLKENNIPVRTIKTYPGWKMIFSFFPLWFQLIKKRPDIIHTHLRVASLLGITAGYFAGIKSRIHTRHHAASNHLYYPHAVKQDKWISKLSTKVVSISDVVTEVLVVWEKTDSNKVIKIPHGFDLTIFSEVDCADIEKLKTKYIPEGKKPVIGMISRYIALKGIDYAIDAFKELLITQPNAFLVLANANGPDKIAVQSKLNELPTESYTEISFEPDIAALYQLFDVFIHIPVSKHSEAFGQTYIEALAAGVPSVFTLSGIACEFVKHKENAWVVPYKNSDAVFEGINTILTDSVLELNLIENGKESTRNYDLAGFISKLEDLYGN